MTLAMEDLSAAVAHLQHTGELHPEEARVLHRYLRRCRLEQERGVQADYSDLPQYDGGRQVLALLEYDRRHHEKDADAS